MNEKIKDRWLIPTVIGVVLIFVALPINAWANGVSLRPPFNLAWVKSILFARLPIWVILLCIAIAVVVGVLMYWRGMTKTKLTFLTSEHQSTVAQYEPLETAHSLEPVSSLIGDGSIVINSIDQYSLRISIAKTGTLRGVQVQIENDRLTSIHQIRVVLLSARSFDSRHGDFRESALSAVTTFTRPNGISPAGSSAPILLVWKDLSGNGLVTGENNLLRRLPWPDRDKSETERWKLSLRVLAFDRPANAAEKPILLKEINADLILLWNRAQNEFALEEPTYVQTSPDVLEAFPANGSDGTSRKIVQYIVCGKDQLLAYTTTRENFPGTRFLVVRVRPDPPPQSVETSDRDAANDKWSEWYQEWKKKALADHLELALLASRPSSRPDWPHAGPLGRA